MDVRFRRHSLLEALSRWGSPAALGRDPEAAALLAKFGGHYLTAEKIAAFVCSARGSVGVRMNAWETRELQDLAQSVASERKKIQRCRKELRRLTEGHAVIEAQTPALGLMTACVLWMCLGDPRNYGSAAAYRKAMGLNLAERSSGKFKGQLHLTKRGPRLVRKWLYFAAMRWMRDGAVRRWTERKKARDGGNGMRAVVAVMRRLGLAVWHVAVHGTAFDAALLFPIGEKTVPGKAASGKTPRPPQQKVAAEKSAPCVSGRRDKDGCAGGEEMPLPPHRTLYAAPGAVKVPPHEYMGAPPSGRSTLTAPGSAGTSGNEVGGAGVCEVREFPAES